MNWLKLAILLGELFAKRFKISKKYVIFKITPNCEKNVSPVVIKDIFWKFLSRNIIDIFLNNKSKINKKFLWVFRSDNKRIDLGIIDFPLIVPYIWSNKCANWNSLNLTYRTVRRADFSVAIHKSQTPCDRNRTGAARKAIRGSHA